MRPTLVFQELRSQARRYVLVGLSMLLGVIGVVAIALGNSVASDMLIAREEQLNGREASFEAKVKPLDDPSASVADTSAAGIYADLLAAGGSELGGVAFELSLPSRVSSQASEADGVPGTSVTTNWVLGDPQRIRRLPIVSGEMATTSCLPGEVMLNQAAAQATGFSFGSDVSLDADSIYQPRIVHISAIVADGQDQLTMYASWDLLECSFPDLVDVNDATMRFVAGSDSAAGLQQIVTDVVGRRGLAVDGRIRRVDTVGSVRDQIQTLSTIFGACAILLLVVSALGIAAVGIASVTERARELVVRRAFGARRLDVFAQVIAGALVVGVLVAALAFALAIAGTYFLLPALIPTASSIVAPAFPWSAALAGTAAAMITSLIGGVIPAVKATMIPIAEALRN